LVSSISHQQDGNLAGASGRGVTLEHLETGREPREATLLRVDGRESGPLLIGTAIEGDDCGQQDQCSRHEKNLLH
jgi:hypothetical protein